MEIRSPFRGTLGNPRVIQKATAPNEPLSSKKYVAGQNKMIEQQFANLRKSSDAREIEAQRQLDQQMAREANASGGFGGAELKLRQNATESLHRGFEADRADLGAAKLQAKMGVSEAERGRELNLAEMRRQFDLEFGENTKTNLVNAMIALKKSGFLDMKMDEMGRFFDSGMGQYYGNIATRNSIPGGYDSSTGKYNG